MNNTINKTDSASRLDWIDFLRGWSIIFVVYAHFSHIPTYLAVVGGYEMPMFYALSGFLTNVRGGVKIKHLFFRIYIPLLTLGVSRVLYEVVRDSNYVELPSLLLYEFTSWFLPTFFFTTVLFRLILIYFKEKPYFLISTAVMLVGYAISGYAWANDANSNNICFSTILMGQWYLMLGYVWKEYLQKSKINLKEWRVISTILFTVFLSLEFIVTPGQYIDIHLSQYPNLAISIGLIVATLLFGYSWGCKVGTSNNKKKWRFTYKPICYLGKNAIYIYLLHGFIKGIISERLLISIYPSVRYDYLNALVYTVLVMLACSVVIFVIDKVCPVLLGKNLK